MASSRTLRKRYGHAGGVPVDERDRADLSDRLNALNADPYRGITVEEYAREHGIDLHVRRGRRG